MTPTFFETPADFRIWLKKNHKTETEFLVGYYKISSGKPSITWSQSVDQALCFGWIDGVRRSIDNESYCIRFTPRRPASIWSVVNIRKIEELKKQGLMQKAGLEIFNNRKISNSGIYSFENLPSKLNDNLENLFRSNRAAWAFFEKQPPSYQKTIIHWIMAAKQEKTRIVRLDKAIQESEKHNRLR